MQNINWRIHRLVWIMLLVTLYYLVTYFFINDDLRTLIASITTHAVIMVGTYIFILHYVPKLIHHVWSYFTSLFAGRYVSVRPFKMIIYADSAGIKSYENWMRATYLVVGFLSIILVSIFTVDSIIHILCK